MRTSREQLPTVSVTIREIMRDRHFAIGVADARAGRSWHREYEYWSVNDQESYERGRAWAKAAPRNLPLSVNGKLNPAALDYSEAIL